MRKVAAFLFGYIGPKRKEFSDMVAKYKEQRAAGLNDREIEI
jgi:hypothetical protein